VVRRDRSGDGDGGHSFLGMVGRWRVKNDTTEADCWNSLGPTHWQHVGRVPDGNKGVDNDFALCEIAKEVVRCLLPYVLSGGMLVGG
jgi:hypothetical protein